ncbi:MAG: isopeptide-forming domain-containing fimbrial protein [Candidatus Dojkabacteria bacterium]
MGSNPTDPNCADITPTPTTIFGSACAEPCSTALGGNACPNDHTCVDNDGDGTGLCQLNSCINNPGSCYSDGCTPVPGCGEPCDPAEGSNACPNDHQCVDVGGQDLCQLNQCITTPSECESNGCDPLGAVTVDKTGTPSCSSTGLQSIVTYQIVVTNPDAGARTFTITDDLDPGVSDSDVSNISGGGSLSSGTITWTDVTISGGSSVTLTYQVVFPESAFNQTFTNTVVVTEAGIERGRDTEDLVPFCTPGTALISDEADRIIFAVALISTGLLMYRLGLHYKIGSFLWNTSVQEVVTKREILKGDPDDMRSFEKETLDDVLDDLD